MIEDDIRHARDFARDTFKTNCADLLDAALSELEHRQFLIDSLMLEYCPDEMSEEQQENWAKNQVKVTE